MHDCIKIAAALRKIAADGLHVSSTTALKDWARFHNLGQAAADLVAGNPSNVLNLGDGVAAIKDRGAKGGYTAHVKRRLADVEKSERPMTRPPAKPLSVASSDK